MKLIIIGPMASGKSVVGRKLSKKLGLQFFDTDTEIERSAGASILGSSMSKARQNSEKENIKFSIK